MQEPEGLPFLPGKALPVVQGAMQQVGGPHHVGAHKDAGIADGTVHVAFGGKMDDGRRTVRAQQVRHQVPVDYVALHQHMARIMIQGARFSGLPQ